MVGGLLAFTSTKQQKLTQERIQVALVHSSSHDGEVRDARLGGGGVSRSVSRSVGRGDGACGGQDAAADSRRCGSYDAGVLPATNFILVTSCGDRKVTLTDSNSWY